MGIPFLFGTLVRKHPGILAKNPPAPTDLHVDFNALVHEAARTVLSSAPQDPDLEVRIYEEVWARTLGLVQSLRPMGTVTLNVDGVAPLAKMLQQRRRRFLSAPAAWDINAISPGTAFMRGLDGHLMSQVRRLPAGGPHVVVSGSTDPGEGEAKIFAAVAATQHCGAVYVHGLDADLLLYALKAHRSSLFVVRDAEGKDRTVVDIDALRRALLKDMGCEEVGDFSQEGCDAIDSFVFAALLLGNDFLPGVCALDIGSGGLDVLLQGPIGPLVRSGRVDWAAVGVFLRQLAALEDRRVADACSAHMRRRCPGVAMDPLVAEIYSSPASWRQLYYSRLFHTRRHDSVTVAHACKTYLDGLDWTHRYLSRLPRAAWWHYPHNYAPSLLDLANHASAYQPGEAAGTEDLDAVTQLVCILPRRSASLLPAKWRGVMTNADLGAAYQYPTSAPLCTFLKRHAWECPPLLPPLDVHVVRRAMAAVDAHCPIPLASSSRALV